MKQSKVLLSIFGIGLLFSVSLAYSIEERQAYNYAYQNSITTMTSIGQADMGGNLTRIAMAKMLSNYAINILGLLPDTSKSCHFSDVSSSLDAQYDNGVTRACQLGLMGVGINQFYPNSKVTRAEFGTVLSRALNAKNTSRLAQMNSAEPYYYEHLRYLQGEGIMNNISNPDSLELRGRVMLMLMRSDKNYVPEEIEDNYPTSNFVVSSTLNGVGLLTICNPKNKTECITMMDRNLGATTNNINSNGSFGYYYQWGNNYGFSSNLGSLRTGENPVDASSYGPGNYFSRAVYTILPRNTVYEHDRSTVRNDNLWGGSGDDLDKNYLGYPVHNPIDRQGPCPDGYHVPSMGERFKVMEWWALSYSGAGYGNLDYPDNWAGPVLSGGISRFRSDFYIPESKSFYTNRYEYEDSYDIQESLNFLRSSSPIPYSSGYYHPDYGFRPYNKDNRSSRILDLSLRSYSVGEGRDLAAPVRCFKNDNGYNYNTVGTLTHSVNKIDTTTLDVATAGCNWLTRTQNSYGYDVDMPNQSRTNDVKFVNKALQDVRDNGQHLVQNYIDEANRVLDSAGLTKRDQCRYSLLIDELENQKGYLKSYNTENGKIVVGIDFVSYKESISGDDFHGISWELMKNTSTKLRYYTLSDDVELELLNVNENGYTNESDYNYDRKYVSSWNVRINALCNNEPVYNWAQEGYNRNEYGRLCTKNMIGKDESNNTLIKFRFDSAGAVDRISGLNYWLTNAG